MPKIYKRILIAAGSIILLLIIAGFGLEWYIKKKLPEVINKPGSEYHVTMGDINFSLLRSTIDLQNVKLVPRASLGSAEVKAGMYLTIPKLGISGVSFLPILYSDRISAGTLFLDRPDIVLVKNRKSDRDDPEKIKKDVVKPFQRLLYIANVECRHANIKMLSTGRDLIMRVHNLNARFGKFELNAKTLSRKLPFKYGEYEFTLDSLYFQPNNVYHLRTRKIKTSGGRMLIDRPEYLCGLSRAAFEKQLKTEQDIYNVKAKNIVMRKLDVGFHDNDTMFFHPTRIIIDSPSANIYRDKRVADDFRKKELYNSLLRKVPFDFRVDTLSITNALIEYEEQLSAAGPGKIRFSKLNLTATNVNSAFHRTKMPDMNIFVSCRFMDTSPLKVYWKLNVLDKTDGFDIKGSILNFDAGAISSFTKPYINVEAEGILNEIYFTIKGNDKTSHGEFAMKYDDFHIKVFRRNDRRKKNKFLTAVGNLLVKNDSKGQVKNVSVEVDRKQDRSFYNFLWLNIAEGLKKTLL